MERNKLCTGNRATGKRANVICTVSTVKDSLENVTNFVHRNLAAGVDHMFIFLEGSDRDVFAFLGVQPHVTVTDTEDGYWGGSRPSNLNSRQTINANRINYLLSELDVVEWLFHIDGDECLDIDKAQFQKLDTDIEYVRLATKESVSTSEARSKETIYFKRLLSPDELSLLTTLGVIEAPRNRKYFHGHVSGKAGIRPSTSYGLHTHEARRLQGETPTAFKAEWLNILHYESFTPEEFLRKWSVHIEAGRGTTFRDDKEIVQGSIKGVLNNSHLDAEQKRRYLFEIYRRRLEDDVPTLLQLGYLEKIQDCRHRYSPGSFPQRDLWLIENMLPELKASDSAYFRPRQTNRDPRVLMERIHRKLGNGDSQIKTTMEWFSKIGRPMNTD